MASSPHEGGTGVEVVVMTVQEAGKEATTPEENNLMEDEGEEDLATPHVEVKPGMGSTSLLSSSLSVESTTTDKIVAVSPDMNGASGEKSVVEETCVKEVVLEQKEVEETLSRRQEQLQKQSRFTKASVIIPPENFAIVEDGLYRSVCAVSVLFCTIRTLLNGRMNSPGSAGRAELPVHAETRSEDHHLASTRAAATKVVRCLVTSSSDSTRSRLKLMTSTYHTVVGTSYSSKTLSCITSVSCLPRTHGTPSPRTSSSKHCKEAPSFAHAMSTGASLKLRKLGTFS